MTAVLRKCSRCGSDKTHFDKGHNRYQWYHDKERNTICSKCNCKDWYLANHDYCLKYANNYGLINHEYKLNYIKNWGLANRDYKSNYAKNWRLLHPDYQRVRRLESLAYRGTDLVRSPELERLAT